jgi:uncharacterized protein (DUF488 family)
MIGTMTMWTMGHSTRPIDVFLGLLAKHRIETLADVRRFPFSPRHPHFNGDQLQSSLALVGIEYIAMPELGGRRRPRPDSRNTVWRNQSFRGYADYMETDAFQVAIQRLLDLAGRKNTVIMCAEAVWWRCHRSLIADYLKMHGTDVRHIVDASEPEEHPYTSVARASLSASNS